MKHHKIFIINLLVWKSENYINYFFTASLCDIPYSEKNVVLKIFLTTQAIFKLTLFFKIKNINKEEKISQNHFIENFVEADIHQARVHQSGPSPKKPWWVFASISVPHFKAVGLFVWALAYTQTDRFTDGHTNPCPCFVIYIDWYWLYINFLSFVMHTKYCQHWHTWNYFTMCVPFTGLA